MRNKVELQKASDHLHYEWSMLLALAGRIHTIDPQDALIRNALLESFILHFRILWDFLQGRRMKPMDVIADDYISSVEGLVDLRDSMPKILSDFKKRTGPAFHLSYKRLDFSDKEKEWPVGQIADTMTPLLNAFVRLVPSELLSARWKEFDKHELN